jgi:hypothetical protein
MSLTKNVLPKPAQLDSLGCDDGTETTCAVRVVESIQVDAFEAQVELPPFQGDYEPPDLETDEELLSVALARSRKHIYKDIPWFRWSLIPSPYPTD